MLNSLSDFFLQTLMQCYFVNSGSEAVEGALKLAKRYTGRSRIISFQKFLSRKYSWCSYPFRVVKFIKIHSVHYCPILFRLDLTILRQLNLIDENTACVITEPVQAEAGVIFPENNFLGSAQAKMQ